MRRLLPTLVLLAVLGGSALAPAARAGHKTAAPYDPVHHSANVWHVIHVYSFRIVTMRRTLHSSPWLFATGTGTLMQRSVAIPPPGCGTIMGWCTRPIDWKLNRPRPCPGKEAMGVWARLYVRPIGSHVWREIRHYHDVVAADC